MIRYNSAFIYEFAQALYNQADLTMVLFTIGGIVIGGALGYLIAELAALIGAVVLGLIGYFIGQGRSFQLKLTAQLALCQVQIEENTRQFSGAEVVKSRPVNAQPSPKGDDFRWVEPTAPRQASRSSSSQISMTEQDKLFLSLFAQELSIVEIASKLGLSEDKVIALQVQLRQKFGVHTNTDMIEKAKERGYL